MDPTLAVTSVPLPSASRATRCYAAPNLADAFAIALPDDASRDPEVLARFIFAHQAPWVAHLLALRDAIVSAFGLKTTGQLLQSTPATPAVRRVSFFRIYAQDAQEILLGEDDRHLDFRLSVRREPLTRQLVMSTVVQCHNRLGRLYILLIAPWHRLVVRSALKHAALAGWPRAGDPA